MNIDPNTKQAFDLGSFSLVILSFFDWIPKVTALLALVWMCIRIYETDTVQRLLGRKK